ncbi:putative N6-adenine-specific DNA methylase [Desulfamplus magnetovallimortis]|uniref:Putative N6-adenine-specific DNA methylase n=1 Tax=Desulfamplus magnetovallimortis TaxID=1246637 RepID=A0A1W1HG82_9BACT|nr:hypothetical protein [Desulfamplus magnetovallimortis]SLM31497.1 putative N6-adenine-specific DNA methylase [Desulfamplus magnetovallimortis]
MAKSAFEKRVKRRVAARNHRFFAVCAPGLKRLCHREMTSLLPMFQELSLPLDEISMIPGGVEFTGTVESCRAANLLLRSPSRVIMRIGKFKAENFRTLKKTLSAFEWELYLQASAVVHCEVSTRNSRLYHKDAVAQRVHQSIMDRFDKLLPHESVTAESAGQTVMVRGENDRFEISLDSSGALLHKRGIRTCVGVAPLRETIAFAILSAAGYSRELPLIDGMCGSGSFSIEAAMMACNIPAGYFRRFAFEHWPCFNSLGWNYLKKKASEQINYLKTPSIFAVDQDGTIAEELERRVIEHGLASSVMVMTQDFFDLRPEILTKDKGIVILNPPYGKRIGSPDITRKMFRDIGSKLASDFKGWRAAIILPERNLMNSFPVSGSLIPIFHGGLELHAAILDF